MNVRFGLLVFLFATGLLIGLGPSVSAGSAQGTEAPAMEPDEIDADEVRMDIALQDDGSAAWTVEFWVQLDDDDSTDAFESLERDIEDDPDAYTHEFADRIDDTVATASTATNREMTADSFRVSTERQSFGREYGVVRYSFQWHGFTSSENGELQAGDAIEGIYLDDGTRLLISWPEEYELISVTPDPDDQRDRAVIWHGGETDFVSGEPRIVVSTAGTGLSWPLIAGSVGAIGAVTGLAFWWFRIRTRDETDEPSGSDPQPVAEPDLSEPDESLLSNEEQVMHLVEENGGRMKQKRVVEELGWTDAKTSKVVSKLREEGELESFRIGRENVLRIPEEEAEKASHHE
ncbi:DUF7345 domain-containing protein [Natrialbaceae archaeon AArc-T1-2]|uniref:DUF7345 domain-containing protein n=1 Tax=Natrialbaceae archaeon AArc-T1-2 TaxID=3053904 RepID=UPI00255ACB65|nr:DUF4897 domain-containing protein [Natrialbaceae archaeon AArc-T1-2]WIV67377.1 DUF4897 domain-containing protein [Natrialbaceae archaeon AArc-T1-2]